MKQLLLLSFFICNYSFVFSQEINPDPFDNRIVLKYYTRDELTIMRDTDYEKFKWVKYYYIHSFIIEDPAISPCDNYTASLVDVKDFESYRLPNRRVTIKDETCGFVITLLSQRELDIIIRNDSADPQIKPVDK